MKNTKRLSGLKLLATGLTVTWLMYLITLNPGTNGTAGMYFENRVTSSFSIGRIGGIGGGDEEYLAGLPFESEYLYEFKGEGCPCDGVSKFSIVFNMMRTIEFIANALFWSVIVGILVTLKRNYENTRD